MLDRFLYHDAAERERLLDLSARLRPTYAAAIAVMTVPALAGASVFGWQTLVPLGLSVIAFALLTSRLTTRRRPELSLLASCTFALAMTLVSIGVADGPKEYLFSLPVFPMVGMAPIFGRRLSLLATLATGAGLVAVGLLTYGDEIRADPPFLILPVMLLIVIVLGSMASRDAEDINRGTAMVDPLTGLLNRVALRGRATEIALLAERSGVRVGTVICDLDHFKSVNDINGHAVGDAVLVEAAQRLQAEIGASGTLFRFGGEEFVVLLPSTTPAETIVWAERLREVIRTRPFSGVAVSASFGVAVSEPGQPFDYHEQFVRADAALYYAKQTGRDRVCADADARPQIDNPPPATAREARRADAWAATAPLSAVAAPTEPPTLSPREVDDGNWLVADQVERAHVVDLLERHKVDGRANSLIALVALIACGPWLGWWLILPPVVAGIAWNIVTGLMPRSRRPEFGALAGLMLIIFGTGGSMMLAQTDSLFGLPLLALTVVGATATFNRIGASLIVLSAAAWAVGAALVVSPGEVASNPLAIVYPVALIIALGALGEAMGRSARKHRVDAITDSLTGALNRSALDARIPELVQQSASGRTATSLLLVDIDHFKAVNDHHGHEVGDAVLAEVAYRLRGALRPFDSVYRIGGEEFLIALTGTTLDEATRIGETLRSNVQRNPVDGTAVTISIGVATGGEHAPFDYDEVFARADAHLYAAKQAGRNRVIATLPRPALLAA